MENGIKRMDMEEKEHLRDQSKLLVTKLSQPIPKKKQKPKKSKNWYLDVDAETQSRRAFLSAQTRNRKALGLAGLACLLIRSGESYRSAGKILGASKDTVKKYYETYNEEMTDEEGKLNQNGRLKLSLFQEGLINCKKKYTMEFVETLKSKTVDGISIYDWLVMNEVILKTENMIPEFQKAYEKYSEVELPLTHLINISNILQSG